MQALNFILSLTNRLSGPLGNAQRSVQQFASASQASFAKIAIGTAALWGVSKTIQGMLNPAHELQLQLDELSINVDSSSLDVMYKKAQEFSTVYGTSAVDFVKSSIAIKRSIDGLTDKELPRYTTAVSTLGVALGKTGEETANYLLDMQNRYSTVANSMGRVQFAEMMASKTAYLAKNFGTDMAKIQAMIKTTKNAGEAFGIDMNEQLAVLGLVGKKIGEEAGGSYNAFLKSVTAGSQKLGLKLTDQNGHLLKMPEIMQKLEAKYGKSIAGNARAQAEINAAFGEGAGVINALWGNTEKLNLHMDALGKTRGLDTAGEMASKMADQWQRLEKIFERVRIAIGMRMMPTLSPFIDQIIGVGIRFAEWLDMFPNISRWLGYIIIAVIGLAAVGAIVNIFWGIATFIWTGLTLLWGVSTKVLSFLTLGMTRARLKMIAWNAILLIGKVAMLAWGAATAIAGGAMTLLTSPVTLIILAIIALVAVVYLIIKHWDWLKETITESAAFQWIMSVVKDFGNLCLGIWEKICVGWQMVTDYLMQFEFVRAIAEYVKFIGDIFSAVWDFIKLGWQLVVDLFSGVSPAEAFGKFADGVINIFSNLWTSITDKFTIFYNWIAEKLNYLPGVDIELKPIDDLNLPDASLGVPSDGGLNLGAAVGAQLSAGAGQLPNVPEFNPQQFEIEPPAGLQSPNFKTGIGQSISESVTKTETTDNSKKIQTLNYYASEKQTADEFMERMELNAG